MLTITQTLRPYLAHYASAADAAERFPRFSADEEGASLAVDCAAAHINLAARRARDALDPVPCPVYAPLAPYPDRCALGPLTMHARLARHASRAAEAAHPGASTIVTAEHVAAARAFDVACHYRRMLRGWQG
jgi:hypothetical protein